MAAMMRFNVPSSCPKVLNDMVDEIMDNSSRSVGFMNTQPFYDRIAAWYMQTYVQKRDRWPELEGKDATDAQ